MRRIDGKNRVLRVQWMRREFAYHRCVMVEISSE